MLDAIVWYLVLQLVGLAALPVAGLVFARLPDRGYALARPVGLLVVGYLLWVTATFGLLQNSRATITSLLVLLGIAAWYGLRKRIPALLSDLRQLRSHIIVTELLLMLAFAIWAGVRSLMPDIAATEKPMEFAFLNAAIRNPTYPPMDPWLSGYSISYYYLGYVLAAVLVQLSGVASGVGFNLMIATLFALTVTGAYSVAYNLVRASASADRPGGSDRAGIITGGVAAATTVLLTNLEGLLELLHAQGFGSAQFWADVGIKDLSHPYLSSVWHPTDSQDMWWWFRASRVVATYVGGQPRDYTINEFPFFSFLLADLHPHVLALPFAFVALSLAANLALAGPVEWPWTRRRASGDSGLARVLALPTTYLVDYPVGWIRTRPVEAISIAFGIGAFGFINAWDLPPYLFVLALGYTIARTRANGGLPRGWLGEAIALGWSVVLMSLVLFAPFYVGFRSQTSGIGVVGYRSQLHHYLLFWGPMLFLALTGLLFLWRRVTGRGSRSPRWSRAWRIVLGLSAALLLLQVPPLANLIPFWAQAPVLAILLPLLLIALETFFAVLSPAPVVPATVGAAPAAEPAEAGADEDEEGEDDEEDEPEEDDTGSEGVRQGVPIGVLLAIAMMVTAFLLMAGTEVVFIRDMFNNRMNTVFKLFYQSWILLAVGSAVALYYFASRWLFARSNGADPVVRAAWAIWAVILIGGALVYPPASVLSRAASFSGPPTLDGMAYVARIAPADYRAIQWLWQNVPGRAVIVEATGGSYSQYGRISWNTGLPTLLGWDFHESQWRGTSDEQRVRQADIDTIYRSGNRTAVTDLLRRYDVTYVYVGPLELEKYGRPSRAGIDALATFLDVAYRADGAIIYKVRR